MSRDRKPGLESVHKMSEARKAGRFTRPTPILLLFAAAGVIGSVAVFKLVASRELDQRRTSLLAARAPAVNATYAAWEPMRTRIEGFTIAAAKEFQGDSVDKAALATWDFRTLPGIYLRLRVPDAVDAKSIPQAAGYSVRDGFVSCFVKRVTSFEVDAGAASEADSPWNLRQAYAANRVLSSEWKADLEAAGDDLRLRVFEQQYEKAVREQLPLAASIVTKAKYFLLVLDELPPAGSLPVREMADGGAAGDGGMPSQDDIQLVPHATRVHVFDLTTNREIVRLRRTSSGTFIPAGERQNMGQYMQEAMQRQVNNCALADDVKTALAK